MRIYIIKGVKHPQNHTFSRIFCNNSPKLPLYSPISNAFQIVLPHPYRLCNIAPRAACLSTLISVLVLQWPKKAQNVHEFAHIALKMRRQTQFLQNMVLFITIIGCFAMCLAYLARKSGCSV